MEEARKKVGFMGLGIMGKAMARNIARAGYPVTVYNRTQEKAAELGALGMHTAPNPNELAANSDVLIAMVTGPEALDALLFGADGAAQALTAGKIFVNMSTVSPAYTECLARRLAPSGAAFVDAPVSGSKKPAMDATLLILAGGPRETVDELTPLFRTMGKGVVYCGEAGKGSMMKMANNLLLGLMIEGLAETLLFGKTGGLSQEALNEVILNGPLNSPIFQMKIPPLSTGVYEPNFPLKHATKDLKFLIETADDMGMVLPSGQTLLSLFRIGLARKWGDLDIAAISKVLETINGL